MPVETKCFGRPELVAEPYRRRCRSQNSDFIGLARRRFIVAAASALWLTLALPAQAADYPTKPVRVFVPYGPGGVGDLTMRILADKLSDQVKQRFVIENRPGAGGIVAMTEVLALRPMVTRLASLATARQSALRCSTGCPLTCSRTSRPFRWPPASKCCSPFRPIPHTSRSETSSTPQRKVPASSIWERSIPAAPRTCQCIFFSR